MELSKLKSPNPKEPHDLESDSVLAPVQVQSTLYKIADVEIRKAIESYLKLARATSGMTSISLHLTSRMNEHEPSSLQDWEYVMK